MALKRGNQGKQGTPKRGKRKIGSKKVALQRPEATARKKTRAQLDYEIDQVLSRSGRYRNHHAVKVIRVPVY